ncbi:MAG: FkbM family methyltransferase, partial [Gemmatimonadetes bacterium]|nr:FkbM family methyltransferase [Gemmatimonadota bacterium]
ERLLLPLKKRHYAKFLTNLTEEDEPDLRAVRYLADPAKDALDVGANIGVYTKFLASVLSHGSSVYSFEPVPTTYAILSSNCKKLGLANVRAMNQALSDSIGIARMSVPTYEDGGENYYMAHLTADSGGAGKSFDVETTTLDEFFRKTRTNAGFLKIDAEGAELSCIEGGSAFLRANRPASFVEISDNPDDEGSKSRRLFTIFEKLGYGAYVYDGRKSMRPRAAGDSAINYYFLRPEHCDRFANSPISVE